MLKMTRYFSVFLVCGDLALNGWGKTKNSMHIFCKNEEHLNALKKPLFQNSELIEKVEKRLEALEAANSEHQYALSPVLEDRHGRLNQDQVLFTGKAFRCILSSKLVCHCTVCKPINRAIF